MTDPTANNPAEYSQPTADEKNTALAEALTEDAAVDAAESDGYDRPQIEVLRDYLEELDDESLVTLFEMVAGLDPMALVDGKFQFAEEQRDLIGEVKGTYNSAGFSE